MQIGTPVNRVTNQCLQPQVTAGITEEKDYKMHGILQPTLSIW